MRKLYLLGLASSICMGTTRASASEVIIYAHDTLGRLALSWIYDGPNSGVTTSTTFDPAGNRTSYNVDVPTALRGGQQNNLTQEAESDAPDIQMQQNAVIRARIEARVAPPIPQPTADPQ